MDTISAAGYVRVSTDEQVREGLSLEVQEQNIRKYVESQGWTLTKIYVEPGLSGKRDDRPELNRLLASLGDIDRVVITKLDRLGRNTRHLLGIYDELETADVALISLGDNIDTSTAFGKAMRIIMSALAELESATTGERVKSVVSARAASGKRHAQWPYGYTKSVKAGRKGGKILEAEAAIVRRIWTEAANGTAQLSLAKALNAEKVPCGDAREWTQKKVRTILSNVTYLGKVEINGEVHDGQHEAIITQETWDRYQALSEARKRDKSGGSRGRNPKKHLFSHGLLKCAHCGGTMIPHTPRQGGGAERYECATKRNQGPDACVMTSVPRALLDTAVFDYFKRVAVDLEATKKQLHDTINAKQIETEALLGDAKLLEGKRTASLNHVQQQFKDGEISAAEWRSLKAEIADELKRATAAREQLERNAQAIQAQSQTMAELDSAAVQGLAKLRDEIVSDVTAASGLDGVRASLMRLFDHFDVARVTADGSALSETDRAVMEAQETEHDEPLLAAGQWVVVPFPREEWAGDLDGYWRSLLRPEPLAIKDPSGNPGGYCGLGGTGVACPIGLTAS
jgi:site-specific DNA recombinase